MVCSFIFTIFLIPNFIVLVCNYSIAELISVTITG